MEKVQVTGDYFSLRQPKNLIHVSRYALTIFLSGECAHAEPMLIVLSYSILTISQFNIQRTNSHSTLQACDKYDSFWSKPNLCLSPQPYKKHFVSRFTCCPRPYHSPTLQSTHCLASSHALSLVGVLIDSFAISGNLLDGPWRMDLELLLILHRLVKVSNLSSPRLMGNYWCSGFHSITFRQCTSVFAFSFSPFHFTSSCVLSNLIFIALSVPCSLFTEAWQCIAVKHKCNQGKKGKKVFYLFNYFLASFEWLHFSMRLNRHETLSRFIHEGMKSLDVGVRIKKIPLQRIRTGCLHGYRN